MQSERNGAEICIVVVKLQAGEPLHFGPFDNRAEAERCAQHHRELHPGDVVMVDPLFAPLVGKPRVMVSGPRLRIVA